jgi:hypothetical protein
MKIEATPGRGDRTKEKLTSYTMRHSAASYIYESKMAELKNQGAVFDLMKARFGWSDKSQMPAYYAKRSIVENATVQVNEIYLEMRAEVDRITVHDNHTKTQLRK